MKVSKSEKVYSNLWNIPIILIFISWLLDYSGLMTGAVWVDQAKDVVVYSIFIGTILYETFYFCRGWRKKRDKYMRIFLGVKYGLMILTCIGCMLMEHFWFS